MRTPCLKNLYSMTITKNRYIWSILTQKTVTTYNQVNNSPHQPCEWPKACCTRLCRATPKVQLNLAYYVWVSTKHLVEYTNNINIQSHIYVVPRVRRGSSQQHLPGTRF